MFKTQLFSQAGNFLTEEAISQSVVVAYQLIVHKIMYRKEENMKLSGKVFLNYR
jgi:hypothetical protein